MPEPESKTPEPQLMVHIVEYLGSCIGLTEHNGPVLIATVRPDEGSFRPHNIGLTAPQADRLRRDLNRLFKNSEAMQAWKQSRKADSEREPE